MCSCEVARANAYATPVSSDTKQKVSPYALSQWIPPLWVTGLFVIIVCGVLRRLNIRHSIKQWLNITQWGWMLLLLAFIVLGTWVMYRVLHGGFYVLKYVISITPYMFVVV